MTSKKDSTMIDLSSVNPKESAEELYQRAFKEMNVDALLGTLVDEFSYQGFDPKITRFEWNERAKTRPNKLEDLMTVLVVLLTRGTKFTTSPRRTKLDAIEKFRGIRDHYFIKENNRTSRNDPKAITVSRVGNAFSELTTLANSSDVIQLKGKPIPNLVKALCWTGAPSIIPLQEEGIFTMWLDWADSFDDLINVKSAVPKAARMDTLYNIAQTAWKSNFFSPTDRNNVMIKIKQKSIPMERMISLKPGTKRNRETMESESKMREEEEV
jgi:hypothetical protein